MTRAVAEIDRPTAPAAGSGSTVTIDNKTDKVYTLVSVETARQPGLLPALSSMFQDFGVDVVKTSLDGDDSRSQGHFFVQSQSGSKLADGMEVERLQRAIESLLDTRFGLKIPRRPQVGGTRDADQRTALLYGLMGELACPSFSSGIAVFKTPSCLQRLLCLAEIRWHGNKGWQHFVVGNIMCDWLAVGLLCRS